MHGDSTHSEHDHDHGQPGHAHHHEVDEALFGTRAFVIGMALNGAFLLVESAYGVAADSAALLADATHNLGDVLGLGLAWGATLLAKRRPTDRLTYGLRRTTLFGAIANASLLFALLGGLMWEALGRLRAPAPAQGLTMSIVAGVGVLVNGGTALLFYRGRKHDVNVRGAFLHLAADAGISAAVLVAGLAIWKTGWFILDPLISLGVSALVALLAWGLLKEALHLVLDGVPSRVELGDVRAYLEALPGVFGVHDLHVWAMSTTEIAMTAHLVVPWAEQPPAFLSGLEHDLQDRFGINHSTVQLEPVDAQGPCPRTHEDAV